jgi:hypothetical protein
MILVIAVTAPLRAHQGGDLLGKAAKIPPIFCGELALSEPINLVPSQA